MKNQILFRIFLILFCATGLSAQDNHYEGLQLGSQNAILSGAAVSRWVDQTAVVLNAATMMNAKEAGITFNSTTGSLDFIQFENGLGSKTDIKTDDAQLYPGLVAAELPFFENPQKNRLGVAIFARIADRTRFTSRYESELNILNDSDARVMKHTSGNMCWTSSSRKQLQHWLGPRA